MHCTIILAPGQIVEYARTRSPSLLRDNCMKLPEIVARTRSQPSHIASAGDISMNNLQLSASSRECK
jgi:hypothetical protein